MTDGRRFLEYHADQLGVLGAEMDAGSLNLVVYCDVRGEYVAALVSQEHVQVKRASSSTLLLALSLLSTDVARAAADGEPVLTAADPRALQPK